MGVHTTDKRLWPKKLESYNKVNDGHTTTVQDVSEFYTLTYTEQTLAERSDGEEFIEPKVVGVHTTNNYCPRS